MEQSWFKLYRQSLQVTFRRKSVYDIDEVEFHVFRDTVAVDQNRALYRVESF